MLKETIQVACGHLIFMQGQISMESATHKLLVMIYINLF